MNRLIPWISGPGRRVPALPRALALAALLLCGVFSATGAFAETNSMTQCRVDLALGRKNLGEFRERPFSALTSASVNYTSVSSDCGSASTSGDGGISSTSSERRRDRAVAFIDIQGEALWQDMAGGSGERLLALGTLAGCPLNGLRAFGLRVQAQFDRLVPASTASPTQVWNNIERLIAEDPYLSTVCPPPKPL